MATAARRRRWRRSPTSIRTATTRSRWWRRSSPASARCTGQPDFATIRIRYVPDQHLVELKSLKLYLWSYRQEGAFHEAVTNRILDDFVAAARPRWVEVVADFSVRGGIKTDVRAVYGKRPALDG